MSSTHKRPSCTSHLRCGPFYCRVNHWLNFNADSAECFGGTLDAGRGEIWSIWLIICWLPLPCNRWLTLPTKRRQLSRTSSGLVWLCEALRLKLCYLVKIAERCVGVALWQTLCDRAATYRRAVSHTREAFRSRPSTHWALRRVHSLRRIVLEHFSKVTFAYSNQRQWLLVCDENFIRCEIHKNSPEIIIFGNLWVALEFIEFERFFSTHQMTLGRAFRLNDFDSNRIRKGALTDWLWSAVCDEKLSIISWS